MTKLCDGAPVSEQATNLCRYKCLKCDMELKSWKYVSLHSGVNSGCDAKFTQWQVAQLITKVVSYTCKICSAKLLCDNYLISRHLKLRHKMLLTQYAKQFGVDDSRTIADGSYSNNVIGDLCVYQCVDCTKEVKSWDSLKIHQKNSSHALSICRDKTNTKKKVYHQCRLCNRTLLCENIVLNRHFKAMHGMDISEYCKATGCVAHESSSTILLKSLKISTQPRDLCVFACRTCGKSFTSSTSFGMHKMEHNHRFKYFLTKCLSKGYSYRCEICSKLLLCDKAIIQGHMRRAHQSNSGNMMYEAEIMQYRTMCKAAIASLPVATDVHEKRVLPVSKIPLKEITSVIGNLCTFSCPSCDKREFTAWGTLMKHLKKVHQQSIRYSPTIVTTARYHSCLICPKAVLSDRYILGNHIQRRHKMSLTKYEKIFCSYGGKTIPTYRKWIKTPEKQFSTS